mgnify:CR=1 FL=1
MLRIYNNRKLSIEFKDRDAHTHTHTHRCWETGPDKLGEGNWTRWLRKEYSRNGVNQKHEHISKYVLMCLLRLYL